MAEDWSLDQTQSQEGWDVDEERGISIKVRGYEGDVVVRVENAEELINKIKETARSLGISQFTVLINRREVTPAEVRNMELNDIESVEIIPFDKGASL